MAGGTALLIGETLQQGRRQRIEHYWFGVITAARRPRFYRYLIAGRWLCVALLISGTYFLAWVAAHLPVSERF
jgi:hypothetical protein